MTKLDDQNAEKEKTSSDAEENEEKLKAKAANEQQQKDGDKTAEDEQTTDPADELDIPSDTAAFELVLGKLRDELERVKAKADENWDLAIRAKAEAENQQRRANRDVENAHKYAAEKFIQGILPVIDSLEMGIEAAKQDGADLAKLLEGSELTIKMFEDTMEKFDIEKLNPVGDMFDPEFHQAMSMQETRDAKPNSVLVVMQKGYLLNERLIRPAMVVVAKAPQEKKETTPSKSEVKIEEKIDVAAKTAEEKVGTNIDEKA